MCKVVRRNVQANLLKEDNTFNQIWLTIQIVNADEEITIEDGI